MNLKETLELHRAHYISHFSRSLQRFPDGFPEVLFELDFPAPDEIFRMYRADMVELKGTKQDITEITLKKPLEHATWVGKLGNAVVEVAPFLWHACILEVRTDRFDRAALIGWGMHWIDVEDTREKYDGGMQGVIHNITPPSYPMGILSFRVDFGTAPVQAAIELIKVLTVGAKEAKVTIGNE